MEQVCLSPGIYRLSELAEILGVSRTSIDRYIERFSLDLTTVVHLNKPVKAIVLTEENIQQLNGMGTQGLNNLVKPHSNPDEPVEQPPVLPDVQTGESPLFKQVVELQRELTETKVEKARIEGEMKRVQEVISSQRETIDTLKTSLMLEAKRAETPMIEYSPTKTGNVKPLGFWSKVKGLFKD